MEKLYYKISEVAEILALPASTIRYYEKRIGLNVKFNGKHKLFTPADIDQIKQMKELRHDDQYNMNGAQKMLKTKKKQKEVNTLAIEKLKAIKALLLKLR